LNFLKKYSLNENELIVIENNIEKPFAINNIHSPADLLTVQKRDGRKIKVNALIAHELNQKKLLHVGTAFLLGNHISHNDQSDKVTIGNKPYSDSAMPPWFGVIKSNICQDLLHEFVLSP
jgi:hypothetical protein